MKLNVKNTPKFTEIKLELGVKQYLVLLHSELTHSVSAGGTLRIYADSLKPNIPYKTILLSTRDTADFAVVEALEKYGLEKENPKEYCIARVSLLKNL